MLVRRFNLPDEAEADVEAEGVGLPFEAVALGLDFLRGEGALQGGGGHRDGGREQGEGQEGGFHTG